MVLDIAQVDGVQTFVSNERGKGFIFLFISTYRHWLDKPMLTNIQYNNSQFAQNIIKISSWRILVVYREFKTLHVERNTVLFECETFLVEGGQLSIHHVA